MIFLGRPGSGARRGVERLWGWAAVVPWALPGGRGSKGAASEGLGPRRLHLGAPGKAGRIARQKGPMPIISYDIISSIYIIYMYAIFSISIRLACSSARTCRSATCRASSQLMACCSNAPEISTRSLASASGRAELYKMHI